MKWKTMLLLLCLLIASTVSCKRTERQQGPHKLNVVVTLFPLYDFARQVGGDKAEVQLLLPPGLEPHLSLIHI